jgi:hypothetical protein
MKAPSCLSAVATVWETNELMKRYGGQEKIIRQFLEPAARANFQRVQSLQRRAATSKAAC